VYLEHSLFGIADTHVISNGPCHSVAEEEEEEEGRRRRRRRRRKSVKRNLAHQQKRPRTAAKET
jgi:hypothetical protein